MRSLPPSGVIPRHRGDQLAHLGAESRAADRPAGVPPPEQAPGLAMPADNTLGSDQDQMPLPVAAAQRSDHDPEQLVADAEPRSPPGRPCQHRELMAEQEILGDERLTVAHGCTDQAEEKKEVLEHRPNMMPLGVCSRPNRLLHPHSSRGTW